MASGSARQGRGRGSGPGAARCRPHNALPRVLLYRALVAGDCAAAPVSRVVVFVQENHTIDNYFRGLAPYGARVASHWPLSPNPPKSDQPHDRRAYFHWVTTGRAVGLQFDTRVVLPYYLYLA